MKTVQKFSREYLEHCETLSPDEIAKFLDDFRILYYQAQNSKAQSPSKLISIKIPQALLDAFRSKAKLAGIPYQTQIKKLMADWL